ncbi:response regulator transcription factor [Streptomyces ehimensis]|uniref:Response regulator transcription factor n=1 Tax=Streptomyces ehimensis TaxID=68195 RepID=A0ABV9BU73_9ACTN
MDAIAEANDCIEALRLAGHHRPDVRLLDIRMPGITGLDPTRPLVGPGVRDPPCVIIVTVSDLDEYVHEALGGGAATWRSLHRHRNAGSRGARTVWPIVMHGLVKSTGPGPVW